MARQVRHLSDIPSRRKFGSKYGGHVFKRYDWNWGRGAKRSLKRTGTRLKDEGRIQHYRVVTYESVQIPSSDGGKVTDRERTVHVLYVRR